MSVPSKIALVGAGGNLGVFVLKEFQAHQQFDITIITRECSKSTFDSDLNVIKVTDDYSEESLLKAFAGQDAVVVMNNAMAGEADFRIIDAAVKAGVRRFIPGHFGGQAENDRVLEVFPLTAKHTKVIDYLRSKESENFSWTAIVTGIFFDLAISNGFLGYDFKDKTARIWDSGDAAWCTSTRPQIAKTVLQVLRQPKKTANRYIYTNSFTTSQNEVLRAVEKATDSKWATTHVKTDDMIQVGREGMKTGEFMKMAQLALAATYGGDCGSDFESDGKLNNELLGIPKENLNTVLAGLVPRQDAD